MNGYKLLVKVQELATIVENLRITVKELEERLSVIETRKVGRPPRKAENEVYG